jgi:hypothetical protein
MVKHAPDETTLIPTVSRDQVSREFSYPLSATSISEAVRDVPQFGKLALAFHARPQSGPLPPEHLVFAEIGCRSRDEWHIWVSAVPSELAARARHFAEHHGFRYLRTWLERRRDDTWFMHWHRCALAVDPITNEGIMAELEEQRVIEQLPPVPLMLPTPSGRGLTNRDHR